MIKRDIQQPLRLPEKLVKELDALSVEFNMSKNDILKFGVILVIKKLRGAL